MCTAESECTAVPRQPQSTGRHRAEQTSVVVCFGCCSARCLRVDCGTLAWPSFKINSLWGSPRLLDHHHHPRPRLLLPKHPWRLLPLKISISVVVFQISILCITCAFVFFCRLRPFSGALSALCCSSLPPPPPSTSSSLSSFLPADSRHLLVEDFDGL